MAKIPFSIEHREKIESGEYKVETRSGKTARVVCWDRLGTHLVVLVGKDEYVLTYNPDGTTGQQMSLPSDLFLVTPEPEMSEWELAIAKYRPPTDSKETIQRIAAELLSIARKQLIKGGYVIEKKAFHDAVENISDKHLAEMSVQYSIHCKVEDGTRHAIMNWNTFQKVAQKFIDIGKAEALKDLPRWKKANGKECFSERMIVLAGDNDLLCTNYAEEGEYYISFSSIEKLPKEDSHE